MRASAWGELPGKVSPSAVLDRIDTHDHSKKRAPAAVSCGNPLSGRADRIRTCDPLTPSQVRYQTAPQPGPALAECVRSTLARSPKGPATRVRGPSDLRKHADRTVTRDQAASAAWVRVCRRDAHRVVSPRKVSSPPNRGVRRAERTPQPSPVVTAFISAPVSPDISHAITPSKPRDLSHVVFSPIDQASSNVHHWPPLPV